MARRIIKGIHGKHLDNVDAYADVESAEYKNMIGLMQKELNVTSLRFQGLEDMISATGLPEENLCTYCWTGKETCKEKKCK
jgi:amidophosphoribosyltransferase